MMRNALSRTVVVIVAVSIVSCTTDPVLNTHGLGQRSQSAIRNLYPLQIIALSESPRIRVHVKSATPLADTATDQADVVLGVAFWVPLVTALCLAGVAIAGTPVSESVVGPLCVVAGVGSIAIGGFTESVELNRDRTAYERWLCTVAFSWWCHPHVWLKPRQALTAILDPANQ